MDSNIIDKSCIDNIRIFVDEHTTATNGRYELREAIEQELKKGTYNYNYNTYYEPILPSVKSIELKYCNSSKISLIRAADIVANKIYTTTLRNELHTLKNKSTMYIEILP